MSVSVKICGINDDAGMKAAVDSGADFVGFVFYPPSRNAVSPRRARELAQLVPPQIKQTGLFVDATDDELLAVTSRVPLNLVQLHGKETPQRVAEVRALTGLPVMMAIRLMSAEHLKMIPPYEAVADRLLFDSRMGAEASGGPIDWSLLKGRTFTKPWMLAGGLNAQNLVEAVRVSGATAIDVSSGVEDRPGHKSPDKIRELLMVAGRL